MLGHVPGPETSSALNCKTCETPPLLLHSLLESIHLGKDSYATLVCSLAAPELAYMWDHQVSGRPLFPGAAFFEMAAGAAWLLQFGSNISLADAALVGVAIPAPLVLPPAGRGGKVAVVVMMASGQLEVVPNLQGGSAAVHLTGLLSLIHTSGCATNPGQQQLSVALACLARQCAVESAATLAASTAQLAHCSSGAAGIHISPAVLDGCLQLGAVKADSREASSQLFVPAGMGALLLLGQADAHAESLAVSQPVARMPPSATIAFTDYSLLSSTSTPICHIEALEAKPLRGSAANKDTAAAGSSRVMPAQEELLYQLHWLAAAAAPGAEAVAAAAASSGLRVGLAVEPMSVAASLIALSQGALAASLQSVGLMTTGAQPPAGGQLVPMGRRTAAASAAWALMRTLAQELASFSVSAIDLPASAVVAGGAGSGNAVFLAAPAGGPSLAPGMDGSAYGHTVQGGMTVAATLLPRAAASMLPAFHLMPRPRGALQSIRPEPVLTDSVAPGQVLVAVKAIGINFRCVNNRIRCCCFCVFTSFLCTVTAVLLSLPAGTCSMCWACTPGTQDRPGATVRAWW